MKHVRCMVDSEVFIYRRLQQFSQLCCEKNTRPAPSHVAARSDVCACGAVVFQNLLKKEQQYGDRVLLIKVVHNNKKKRGH